MSQESFNKSFDKQQFQKHVSSIVIFVRVKQCLRSRGEG